MPTVPSFALRLLLALGLAATAVADGRAATSPWSEATGAKRRPRASRNR